MRRLPLVLALALALVVPASAHADLLPDGYKGVRLSIKVDAEVPAGKALILANTFRGADVIKPGEAQKVEWHPLGGQMQLRMIDAADVAAIVAAREGLDRDGIRPIADKGANCSPPIEGVRTVPETEPYDEIRWSYKVTFKDSGCAAELTATDRLKNEDGDAPPPPPPGSEPPPAEAPKAAATPAAPKGESSKPAAAAGGCGCTSGDAGGGAGSLALGLIGIVGLVGRRRRRR